MLGHQRLQRPESLATVATLSRHYHVRMPRYEPSIPGRAYCAVVHLVARVIGGTTAEQFIDQYEAGRKRKQ